MQHPVNTLKKALSAGKFQLGVWSGLCSPLVAEILSDGPFDWLTIDMEHSPNTLESVLAQLQAMRGGMVAPIVRPPWNDFVVIKQLLDAGAQSFIIPYVQNAEEAARAVAATRYPPRGIRGVAGGSRATRFGRIADYLKHADEEICVIVQAESVEALDNIEAIAAVDGVDGIFVGPADLSASMGLLGQLSHPDLLARIAEAADRINATGKVSATLSFDPAMARAFADMGFQMVAAASDTHFLLRGAASVANGFADLRG
ncbi:MAG: HpcH/HpaI aldolase/citrate lyase family protein [Nitratireductor sp.]|nr:HpcH/HpaI aldolase/citrate lyase family protein [Nitratireductor sp.]